MGVGEVLGGQSTQALQAAGRTSVHSGEVGEAQRAVCRDAMPS